jgi:hypothetical protein
MMVARIAIGIILCIAGGLFVVFELGMLYSEPHLFLTGGWIPFSIFVVLGVIMCIGGALLLKG